MELLFVCCIGAVFGSFANVLIYRIPRNLSIISPNSFCPQCKRALKWRDKIPILSFLLCRASCRYCGARIPNFYLISEVFGTLLAALCFLFLGTSGIPFFFFLLTFYVLSIIDIDFLAIPDGLNFLNLFLCGICAFLFYDSFEIVCVSGLSFMGFASFLRLFVGGILQKEVLGEGDIIVFGVLGVGLEASYGAIAIFLAAIYALIFFAFCSLRKRTKNAVPFVPFLFLGFLSAFIMQIL